MFGVYITGMLHDISDTIAKFFCYYADVHIASFVFFSNMYGMYTISGLIVFFPGPDRCK